ncbi:carboxymuconolactone decarboxylase family protein [Alicyclobacillus ferrooxydans]|nr:carboxymuconolactone decarboxylase family protein [Alicyclobacillus ferrooxydans]
MDKIEEPMVNEIQDFVYETVNDYKEGLGWLANQLPDVGKQFLSFSAACFQDGEVSERHKHLMAMSIGIHTQDEYCILYHGSRAIELGASDQELLETIGVCAAFGGGAGLAQGITLVRDMMQNRAHLSGRSAHGSTESRSQADAH